MWPEQPAGTQSGRRPISDVPQSRPWLAWAAVFIVTGALFRAFQTRLRKANRRLTNAVDEEHEPLRDTWASIVAHDLRQPLSVMTLRCSMLLRTALSDEQREDVQQIKASVDWLEGIVSDVTDASLLGAHRMRLTLGCTEVAALLHEALRHVPLAASRARIRMPPGMRLFVNGDARRLERVLEIVLSNAVEHSAPETPIDIEITGAGGNATIAVTNRGKGIPPGELPRLFERHVRAHSAGSSTRKGLGLGLYIAKGLVEAQRGRIWAESEPIGLTTFHIAIPLLGPPEPATASCRADNDVPPRELHREPS